jgi:hypothetical protein
LLGGAVSPYNRGAMPPRQPFADDDMESAGTSAAGAPELETPSDEVIA